MLPVLSLLVLVLGDNVCLLVIVLVDHAFGTPGPGLPAVAVTLPVHPVAPAI